MAEKRIVALFDCHVPFNIPLGLVFEFIQDFKPTEIILGGDAHDWTAVSQWIADQSRALDGGTIMDNYRALGETVLTPLRKAGGRTKIVYLTGNHEAWLNQAAILNPNGRGYWELENNLPKDIQIVPLNKVYSIGPNLVATHGVYTNMYHAKKTVEAFHTSVIYGHVHTFQSHTLVSPIDSEKYYIGQSIGCLSTLNPSFMKNRPNAWMNGFCYIYLNGDGSFHHVPVIIVNGKFYANGRKYK